MSLLAQRFADIKAVKATVLELTKIHEGTYTTRYHSHVQSAIHNGEGAQAALDYALELATLDGFYLFPEAN